MFSSTVEAAAGSLANGAEVPRNHDSDDDSSYDFVITVPRNREIELALEQIEDRLEAIEDQLAACAPLVGERQQLLEARAALVDKPVKEPTGEPPVRVTRADVATALADAPGSRAGELARALATSQQIVSAHLYRGRESMFENRGRRWYLRAGPISA